MPTLSLVARLVQFTAGFPGTPLTADDFLVSRADC
jgi:hypothetical protein